MTIRASSILNAHSISEHADHQDGRPTESEALDVVRPAALEIFGLTIAFSPSKTSKYVAPREPWSSLSPLPTLRSRFRDHRRGAEFSNALPVDRQFMKSSRHLRPLFPGGHRTPIGRVLLAAVMIFAWAGRIEAAATKRSHPLSEAAKAVVSQFLENHPQVEAGLTQVGGGRLHLDRGRDDGLTRGAVMEVFRPDGRGGEYPGPKVGEIELTRVRGAQSEARVLSREGPLDFLVGDRVVPKERSRELRVCPTGEVGMKSGLGPLIDRYLDKELRSIGSLALTRVDPPAPDDGIESAPIYEEICHRNFGSSEVPLLVPTLVAVPQGLTLVVALLAPDTGLRTDIFLASILTSDIPAWPAVVTREASGRDPPPPGLGSPRPFALSPETKDVALVELEAEGRLLAVLEQDSLRVYRYHGEYLELILTRSLSPWRSSARIRAGRFATLETPGTLEALSPLDGAIRIDFRADRQHPEIEFGVGTRSSWPRIDHSSEGELLVLGLLDEGGNPLSADSSGVSAWPVRSATFQSEGGVVRRIATVESDYRLIVYDLIPETVARWKRIELLDRSAPTQAEPLRCGVGLTWHGPDRVVLSETSYPGEGDRLHMWSLDPIETPTRLWSSPALRGSVFRILSGYLNQDARPDLLVLENRPGVAMLWIYLGESN